MSKADKIQRTVINHGERRLQVCYMTESTGEGLKKRIVSRTWTFGLGETKVPQPILTKIMGTRWGKSLFTAEKGKLASLSVIPIQEVIEETPGTPGTPGTPKSATNPTK